MAQKRRMTNIYLFIYFYRGGAAYQATEGVASHGQSGARKTGMDKRPSCTQDAQHQKGTNQETYRGCLISCACFFQNPKP